MLTTGTVPKINELLPDSPKSEHLLKVGVLGFGGIGQVHAVAYAASPRTELHSIATRNQLALQGAALFFGITNFFENYDEALKDPDLQAVSICVPTFAHKEYIIAAAKAGKHILCEKPFLLHPDEWKEIENVLNEKSVKLMVAMICRFQPHYAAAKKTIEKGEIGPIVSLHARRRVRSPPTANWFWDVEKSGGIAVDLAIHDIDLIQWYLGSDDPIEIVYTVGSNNVYPEIKTWDTVIITLKSRSGVLATIEASWAEPNLPYHLSSNTGMTIYGEEGTIRIDPSQQPSQKITELDGIEPNFEELDMLPAFVDQVSSFAKAVLDDEPVPVSFSEGLSALRVARAALKSLQQNKIVFLEDY
jgi:predicted dehydrogenase